MEDALRAHVDGIEQGSFKQHDAVAIGPPSGLKSSARSTRSPLSITNEIASVALMPAEAWATNVEYL